MNDSAVFVVDDDEMSRALLSRSLERVGLRVVECASAEAFLAGGCQDRAGCLLLDLQMPGMGGMALLEKLVRRPGPRLPVIVLTGKGDIHTAVEAMKLGAFDFIEKGAGTRSVVGRAREALALDARQRREAGEYSRTGESLRRLTPREQEVLERLMLGETSRELADGLDISERTAEKHRAAIMQKFGCHNVVSVISKVGRWRAAHAGQALAAPGERTVLGGEPE
jgi:FixJ family two-component response regulator